VRVALARGFLGPTGNLAATMPKPGQSWQAAGFEAVITFGLVLMILNLANGPKLNGPFVPRRGQLHHGLGHDGRALRRCVDEPRQELRT
jgi:hypothetical protein